MADLFSSGVIPIVNDYLVEESKKVRSYGDYWSASSAGYCMRKVIFDRLKVPPVTEDARKQRVFSSGHIFHEWIQGLTKASGVSISSELELQDEKLMVRGHFDDLVLIDGKLIVYDYKTQHSRAFSWAKKNPKPMSHYHAMQLGTYIYMLRKWFAEPNPFLKEKTGLTSDKINEGRILKISKDDLMMAEEQLLWTPELEKKVYEYWSTLNGYWSAKKIPACTCHLFEVNPKTGKGFMADPRYNPYYFNNEPCSLDWMQKTFKEGLWQRPDEKK